MNYLLRKLLKREAKKWFDENTIEEIAKADGFCDLSDDAQTELDSFAFELESEIMDLFE